MKVYLEILASTNIKRKKPWPRIIWIGEEQESLLLLDPDGKRISVLYVPSGKTKKKLPKLTPLAEKVVCFGQTQNGRFLLGVLQNSEIFVWLKDKDVVRYIEGLNRLTQNLTADQCQVAASDDCSYVLVTVGHNKVFLWVTERGETIELERDAALKGSWHAIPVPNGMELPGGQGVAPECSMASMFYNSPVLGHCCQLSLVYNKQSGLSIATLVLKFPDPVDSLKNLPLFSSEWSLLEYPFQQMHPEFTPISTTGAYVSCYTSNGHVMAVAANQKAPSHTVLLFVSPLTDTVLVGGMKNCGVGDPSKYGRQYWVADISWTSDSLFLACMLNNGSVCLVTRLGEPIAIQTDGCSVNMGPSYFLPLHPAIMVSSDQGNLDPSPADQDPLRQRFSVSTHPWLPIILFSDGFLVTVAQLPVETTSVTLMRDFVLSSASHLKSIYKQQNLDMTVADAYKLSKGSKGSKQQLQQQQLARQNQGKPYEFEMAEISLNATRESETSMIETANKFGFDQFGAVGNLDAGKIVFGEPEMISIDLNATFSGLDASDALLKHLEEAMSALTSAWKLAVSFPDIWTAEVDNIAKQTVHNLSKIFSIVLDCPAVDAIIPVLTPRQNSAIQNPRVYNIIVVYRNLLQLLRFDTYNQHVIIATLRLVHKVITLMLTSEELERSDPKLKTLFGCFSLLKHAETCLNRVYVWVPASSEPGTQSQSPRMFEPATLVKLKCLSHSGLDHPSYKGQLPGKRLAATWKLLYKHILEYQTVLSRAGDPNRELHQLEKLVYNVQEVLQDTDSEITPRSAAKLSPVWLRNAFPFGLLSESDNFAYPYQNLVPTTKQPSSFTPSPRTDQNSPTVHSYSSSPSPIQSSRNPSPLSPIQNAVPQMLMAMWKNSKNSSILPSASEDNKYLPQDNGSKSGIFGRIKSAVTKQKESPRINADIKSSIDRTCSPPGVKSSSSSSFLSENSSSLRVAEYSSSPKENSNFKVTVTSYSSSSPKESSITIRDSSGSPLESSNPKDRNSPKGSSSHTSSNELSTLMSSGKNSSIPVINLDSPPTQANIGQTENDQSKSHDPECPHSEGFELEMTHEIESSRKSESIQEFRELSKTTKVVEEFMVKTAKLSVDGQHTQAVEAWKEQLRELSGRKDSPKTAKMLHSVLYTYLVKDQLDQALDFVDSLVMQASVDVAMSSQELPAYDDGSQPPLMTLVTHRSKDSEEEELVPCIKNKSIRQTLQTMARFMAAYFCNETMFIFPPHSAHPLPTVHMGHVPTKSRIVPKYHEDITNVITRENLSSKWTTERTVEYLLLSGLVCETAWFAYTMGDWKTAFLLSVAHTSHREIASQLYAKVKKPLQLPASLSPAAILQERLEVLVKFNKAQSTPGSSKHHKRYFIPINEETNIGQLTRTLDDTLTTALVCDVEIAPWLFSQLLDKLRSVVSQLPSLVPQDFYLPAPPLYCPQPGEEEMEASQPDVQYEKELRLEISSTIQLTLLLLGSGHLSLPLARWYIQELVNVQDRASQFKATTEGPCLELPEILQQYKTSHSDLAELTADHPSISEVLVGFRDLCTILWLLHVRDELSLQLRRRGTQMRNQAHESKESPESTLGRTYVQECFVILKWAVHMLAFSQYLADDSSIQKVVLSLILELPATEDTADILAEHFYAAETFDPEVQEKLGRLLATWQSVEIQPEDDGKSARPEDGEEQQRRSIDEEDEDDGSVRKSVTFYQASPRAKTLSVYYHKQCEVVQKVLKKKRKCFGQYEEFVFHQVEEMGDEFGGSEGGKLPKDICIGSRPFETKQSYLEFLDRFYAICFTKVVQKESEGSRKQVHPALMPFARAVREAEFQAYLKKHEDTFQKRPSSVVMASPRAKLLRGQNEAHSSDNLYDSKSSPSSPTKRSLFRSNSSGDVHPPPNMAALSRHVSEGNLNNKNSPQGSGRPPLSSTRGKQNMTGMASRFFQSEEVLYRDPDHSQEAHWILDVNFGQRYLALQQLLDYVNSWVGRQHSLGLHGKSDRDLGIKPTMRIEVPSQLVVLALWLLDNKYSSSKKRQDERDGNEEPVLGVEAGPVDEKQIRQAKARALATVEELTERDSFTQVSNIQRSRSISPAGRRSRSHSHEGERSRSAGFNMSRASKGDKTLDSVRSITSTQEETEQIKSAYKKVLDGGDDSSSLEVSSLEPEDYEEDLKHTLSVIGSDKARRRRSPGRRRSPSRQNSNQNSNNTLPFDSSPDRAGNQPPQTSTPVRGGSLPRGQRTADGVVQGDISRISVAPGLNTAPPSQYREGLLVRDPAQTAGSHRDVQQLHQLQQQSGGVGNQPGGLAEQLQQIVRGELRRMMQVQHQSMMAMMGALDGQPVPQPAWPPEAPTNQRQEQVFPPGDRKQMSGVLRELSNLKQTADQTKKKKSRSPSSTLRGKENVDSALRYSNNLRSPADIQLYRVTQDNSDPSLRMLRIPSEPDQEGVRFPFIPYQAWQAQEAARVTQAIPNMPLLQLNNTPPAPIFPPPSSHYQQMPAMPGPGYFQSQTQKHRSRPQAPQKLSSINRMDSPDSGISVGIPLLKIPTDDEAQGQHPRFGELYPPEEIMGSEKEERQQEMLKERYLREFHNLQAEKAEAQEAARFGENLLHLNLGGPREGEEPRARPRTTIEREEGYDRRPKTSPRKTPRSPSPRKTPRSGSEQISSRKEKSSSRSVSEKSKSKSRSSRRQVSADGQPMGEEYSDEGEESADEDATEAESVPEEEEAEEELHEGYVFPQGEFDAYLALEQQLAKTKDTHARIQLKTAIKLQQRRLMENWKRPKVDFATNTNEMFDAGTEPDIDIESRRTTEKATSITKDRGVDPIHEAVIEYNKNREPAVLPPDIYMGLRFTEVGRQPDVAGDTQDSQGRAYLNVVDLDASAVLRDMGDRPDQEEPVLDRPTLPTQQYIRHRIGEEEAGQGGQGRPRGADELTVKLFETKVQGEDRFSLAIMPRDSMPESKFAIMQRLRDMNSQLAAIDRMSNNIEREFKNTRLAINTLDHMTEAMEAKVDEDDLRKVEFEEDDSRGASLTPGRHSGRSGTPIKSARSPKMSARHTARSQRSGGASVEDKRQMSSELAKLSGLSGISDIIGDMVAKGDIDLDDVGLTQGEADRLVQRGFIRHEEIEEARMSLDDIKRLSKEMHREGYDKDQLRHWMAKKRRERMLDYRRHLDELRQKEIHPYKSKPDNMDQSLLEVKDRENARKDFRSAAMTKRLGEAESLLGNLLTEKPEVPREPAPRPTPQRTPCKDRSPGSARRQNMMTKTQTIAKKSPSPVRKPVSILKSSPPYSKAQYSSREHVIDDLDDDYYMEDIQMRESGFRQQPPPPAPVSRQIVVQPRSEREERWEPDRQDSERREPAKRSPEKRPGGMVPRLRLSLDEVEEEPHMQRTGETTGDLSAYYRAVEAMDVTSSHDVQQPQPEPTAYEPTRDDGPPAKQFKPRPYTDLVRVQRPHVTKKQPNKLAVVQGRLQTVSQADTSRTSARSQLTQREQEMIYGSKHLPGQRRQRSGPVRVKTYTERLQEMKSGEKYSTPVAPKSHLGSSIASQSARTSHMTRVVKPKHKPMTYVEQLQKLNEGHHKPRVGTATTVIQKPIRRSHKPAHKPLTYAEQLQALQPPKTTQGPPSKRLPKAPTTRQRPYRDPYARLEPGDLDRQDAESVVSAWSMGDDVRHLIYDDVESSIAVGQSASYAPSEQVSDYFDHVMGDDYTASVDIDDLVKIADDGSVSSGSMMSYIDWDQVDDLIADVR